MTGTFLAVLVFCLIRYSFLVFLKQLILVALDFKAVPCDRSERAEREHLKLDLIFLVIHLFDAQGTFLNSPKLGNKKWKWENSRICKFYGFSWPTHCLWTFFCLTDNGAPDKSETFGGESIGRKCIKMSKWHVFWKYFLFFMWNEAFIYFLEVSWIRSFMFIQETVKTFKWGFWRLEWHKWDSWFDGISYI